MKETCVICGADITNEVAVEEVDGLACMDCMDKDDPWASIVTHHPEEGEA
jgi:hypothetical protein